MFWRAIVIDSLRQIWQAVGMFPCVLRFCPWVAALALLAWNDLASSEPGASGGAAPADRNGSAPAENNGSAPKDQSVSPSQDQSSWCAPELTQLTENVCYYSPVGGAAAKPKGADSHGGSLVIFLHSLVSAKPQAAWEQQLRMRRLADTYGFSMLVPRGRPGLGPGRAPDVLAWPTAQALQEQYEGELIDEWNAALRLVVASRGQFERTFLFGFSNGAYYTSSLIFRERFPCDGAAAFAGGSGSKYQRLLAQRAKHRTPFFVAYGTLDPDNAQQRSLVTLLRQLDWPHRAMAAKVGHTVASRQLESALEFLGHTRVE